MSGNFAQGSEMRAGGWVRSRQMKLAFLSLRCLEKVFSRGCESFEADLVALQQTNANPAYFPSLNGC